MRYRFTFIFLLSIAIVFSQTIEQRERDLNEQGPIGSWGSKKNKARELLSIDKFNLTAIEYLLNVYFHSHQKDSISIFYDSLIAKNKKSATPLLIRVQLAQYESLNYDQKMNYLKSAALHDSTNMQVPLLEGRINYALFNKAAKIGDKETSDIYAKRSFDAFQRMWLANRNYREKVRYSLIQLSSYLKDTLHNQSYKIVEKCSLYFPQSIFDELPTGWETNYAIDVIRETEFSKSGWYSEQLSALGEPILCSSSSAKIVRFLWLRTFDNPIVIRLENKNNIITLCWKMGDGMGGYKPGKMIINARKQIPLTEWTKIEEKLTSIDFSNRPSSENQIIVTDGAQWILEYKEIGKYHYVDRWDGMEITNICMDLLRLTDLKIGKIY